MPGFRPQKKGFECYCCKRYIPFPAHVVEVRASWRRSNEEVCMNCWYSLMQYAQVGLLQQEPLPE
jgi:hypothetical protein